MVCPYYARLARDFARTVPEGRYHEIRYEKLVTEAKEVLAGVLGFLNEPWSDEVLAPYNAQHDISKRGREFQQMRRNESGQQSSIYTSRIGIGKRELNPIIKLRIRRSAGRMMQELGY